MAENAVRARSGHDGTGPVQDLSSLLGATELDPAQFHGWVLESMAEAVNVADERDAIVYANAASHALYGYAPGELIGQPISALRDGTPDEIAQVLAAVKHALTTQGSWAGEFRNHRKDGRVFFTHAQVARLRGGAQNYWICVQRDITPRRELEQAARETRQRLEELAALIDEVYWVCSPDRTRLYYLGPSFEKVWGRSRAEFLADPRKFLETIHPDDLATVLGDLQPQLSGDFRDHYEQEYRIVRPDGTVRWILTRYLAPRNEAGGTDRVVGVSMDITDRKRMEQALLKTSAELERRVVERTAELAAVNARLTAELAERRQVEASLRESEATNRALLAAIPDLIFRISRDGRFLTHVPTREVRTYVPPAEFVGKRVDEVLPHDVATACFAAIDAALQTGALQRTELRLPMEGGERDYEGRVAACGANEVLVIVRDVTEQKLAEEQLRASEQRLRDILDSMFVFVGLFLPDGTLIEVNQAPLEVAKLTREELLGRKMWDTYWWSYSHKIQEQLKSVFWRAAQGEAIRFDVLARVAGGGFISIDVAFGPLRDATGQVVQIVGSGVDITDRLRSQDEARRQHEELTHVLRVATVGEMATGIAHELNQPLTSIAAYSHALGTILERLSDPIDARLPAIAANIGEQAVRAGEIIHGLRDFVRKATSRRVPENINSVVGRVLSLVLADARLLGISLETRYDHKLPPVSIDAVQIQQVVLNLIRNSLDSIGTGQSEARTIRVETARYSLERAVVAITDTGPGLSPEMLETVFGAFYTTKPSGLGMGLPISRSIVESHGGRLWAKSVLGRGATFRFTVPFEKQRSNDDE